MTAWILERYHSYFVIGYNHLIDNTSLKLNPCSTIANISGDLYHNFAYQRIPQPFSVRQAAFECMYTLLETCRAQIEIHEYMKQVLKGLSDHYDIKMLTHLMLIRVVHLCPDVILQC